MKTKVLSLGLLVLSWWSILCVPAVGCPSDPPPPVCEKPECQIWVPGLGCVRNCLSNPLLCCYCPNSLCSDDCSMDCCPDCVTYGWCPIVSFDELYPNHHVCTCVGCEVDFVTQLPFGCYCPSCCGYLTWTAPGGNPSQQLPTYDYFGCDFVTKWDTPGEYTVTAGLLKK